MQIMAMIITVEAIGLLLGLRYLLLANKHRPRQYRAFIAEIADTHPVANPDLSSMGRRDSPGISATHCSQGNHLAEWPSELEPLFEPTAHSGAPPAINSAKAIGPNDHRTAV